METKLAAAWSCSAAASLQLRHAFASHSRVFRRDFEVEKTRLIEAEAEVSEKDGKQTKAEKQMCQLALGAAAQQKASTSSLSGKTALKPRPAPRRRFCALPFTACSIVPAFVPKQQRHNGV